tara:strand:- start:323 stop:553 length:231 start_codon:yes stop_codon:yes gene_type:complete
MMILLPLVTLRRNLVGQAQPWGRHLYGRAVTESTNLMDQYHLQLTTDSKIPSLQATRMARSRQPSNLLGEKDQFYG